MDRTQQPKIDRLKYWGELYRLLGFTIPVDGLISVTTEELSLDISKLDDLLGQKDPEYNPKQCTYKGQPQIYMADYLNRKYGQRAVELVQLLF